MMADITSVDLDASIEDEVQIGCSVRVTSALSCRR
jgi:hypothetical protein